MEKLIANLIQKFEEGKLDRRQLIRNLAIAAGAATAIGAVTEASAAEAPFSATAVHHLSFTAPNYAKSRDFYANLLGLKVSNDDGKTRCTLSNGSLFMNVRTGDVKVPLVDHFGVAVEGWTKEGVGAGLKARGLNPKMSDAGISYMITDPDGYKIQLDKKRA